MSRLASARVPALCEPANQAMTASDREDLVDLLTAHAFTVADSRDQALLMLAAEQLQITSRRCEALRSAFLEVAHDPAHPPGCAGALELRVALIQAFTAAGMLDLPAPDSSCSVPDLHHGVGCW